MRTAPVSHLDEVCVACLGVSIPPIHRMMASDSSALLCLSMQQVSSTPTHIHLFQIDHLFVVDFCRVNPGCITELENVGSAINRLSLPAVVSALKGQKRGQRAILTVNGVCVALTQQEQPMTVRTQCCPWWKGFNTGYGRQGH